MIKFNDYQFLYDTDTTFQEYVDRYAHKHGISVVEALKHKIITDYAEDIWYARDYNL